MLKPIQISTLLKQCRFQMLFRYYGESDHHAKTTHPHKGRFLQISPGIPVPGLFSKVKQTRIFGIKAFMANKRDVVCPKLKNNVSASLPPCQFFRSLLHVSVANDRTTTCSAEPPHNVFRQQNGSSAISRPKDSDHVQKLCQNAFACYFYNLKSFCQCFIYIRFSTIIRH